VFKDREPIKKKYIVNWEEEQILHQYFVKTIQEMQTEDPPQNLIPKEKAQWSTSWVRLPESKVSTELIVSQSLSINPINKVMSMEQIFQDISEQMLETIYILGLNQLLKITLDLKKYMRHKLKPKKPNIATKMILKPSVTTMVETHFELDIAATKVDN